jgi:Ni,Fe-hydrogenase III small subunit
MIRLARRLYRTGRLTEPAPERPPAPTPGTTPGTAPGTTPGTAPETATAPGSASVPGRAILTGSVQVRHVDAGSCNGCEIEIASAFGPVYDVERFGARLVASPRHADLLLVTGAVTRNLAEPLRRTYEAAARPVVVIALGDCARDCGVFAGGYGVHGPVGDIVPVDVQVPGCPPEPQAIVAALRSVTGR